jgi:GNAT superfamily N-acetyltransferase
MADWTIRSYQPQDRSTLRRISCQTAFLETRVKAFSDDEVLADALTRYYTDFEPQSCFVAVSGGSVIGYIIGAKDTVIMEKVFNKKIIFPLLLKALLRGVFFHPMNLKFFYHVLRSCAAGEFRMPSFSREYPATLHINIDRAFRGQGVGRELIKRYLDYLRAKGVAGVCFATLSTGARDFFIKNGFQELFHYRRSYLAPYTGEVADFFLIGVKL